MFFNIIFYSFLAGGATLLGVFLLLWQESWTRKNTTLLVSFSAGVLISAALAHLIPEAIELSSSAFLFTLGGFLIFYLLENLIMFHSCTEEGCPTHIFGLTSAVGLGFHSLVDGIAIGVGFEVSMEVGIIATLAVLLHELPEGIATLSILFQAGIEKEKALLYSFGVALATPLGAILILLLGKIFSRNILGILLAIAAGSFLYVAASDLIPQTHKKFSPKNVFFFVLGVIFIYLVKIYF